MIETIAPQELSVGDRVSGNGALWEVIAIGEPVVTRFVHHPAMVDVRCADPRDTAFRTGFTKQFVLETRTGTWERHRSV